MTYTEIQERNGRNYYYRVKSIKEKGRVLKVRRYLGVNIGKKELAKLEREVDNLLDEPLVKLLTSEQRAKLAETRERHRKQPESTFENRYEAFLAQFTYDSNAIEGNTLTLRETSYILFEHKSPRGSSLREINEVLNHKEAFDFVLGYKGDVNKKFMCDVQGIVVKNTLRRDLIGQIGKYRNVQVYIRGAEFVPPKPKEARIEMANLLRWYKRNKEKLHPLILAAYFHVAFESIHPFVDGNGRAGRLLMNFILSRNGFPMVNIPNKRKLAYYGCLDCAREGKLKKFVDFLYDLMMNIEIHV